MRVDNVKSLQRQFVALRKKAEESNEVVIVGYTQSYAVYVHEDLNARHAEGKQAKFLEDALLRLRNVIAELIHDVYKKTGSMAKALLIAGLRVQRESQDIVPIDTGALRASAYTALERDANAAAAAAFDKSESIRREQVARRDLKKPVTPRERARRKR